MDLFIVLGAARSGTTFLSENCIASVSEVFFLGEPNFIWMHGHAYRSHDLLSASDASEGIKCYIRRRFKKYLADSGVSILVEKTPANCLRIPFIREVFPQARFIHVVRDGRAVVASAVKEWDGSGFVTAKDRRDLRKGNALTRVCSGLRAWSRLRDRIQSFRDIVELPSYLPRLGRFLLRNLFPGRDYLWGPRFPNMRGYRSERSLYETCAEQWRWQVQSVLNNKAGFTSESFYELRFEELVVNPKTELKELFDWMNINVDPLILDQVAASIIKPQGDVKYDPLGKLSVDDRKSVEAIIGPLMVELGYTM